MLLKNSPKAAKNLIQNKNEPTFRERILNWNTRYPLDIWWRKKHGMSLFCEQHNKTNLIFMLFEFLEFVQLEIENNEHKIQLIKERRIKDGESDFFSNPNAVKMSQKEIEDEFENLDLEQFKDE